MIPYKTKGKRILFCPGCKRVYEIVRMYGGNYKQKNKIRTYRGQVGKKPKYYPGLSSYGLTREVCPECVLNAVKVVKAENKEIRKAKKYKKYPEQHIKILGKG